MRYHVRVRATRAAKPATPYAGAKGGVRVGRGRAGRAMVVGLAMALGAGRAGAVTIQFLATDLPDMGTGDRWETQYFVSGQSFPSGYGFSILFPVGSAEHLQVLPTHSATDWDAIAIQPDPMLASDGRYDAQALVANATLATVFSVAFDWTGAGSPGSQAFQIYDGSFSTIAVGETVPVPEPEGLALLASGIGGLALGRRRAA